MQGSEFSPSICPPQDSWREDARTFWRFPGLYITWDHVLKVLVHHGEFGFWFLFICWMKFLVLLGQEDSPGGLSVNPQISTQVHTHAHTLHTYIYTHIHTLHTYTDRESKGEKEEGLGCGSLEECLSNRHKALSSSPTPFKLVWRACL